MEGVFCLINRQVVCFMQREDGGGLVPLFWKTLFSRRRQIFRSCLLKEGDRHGVWGM